MSIEVVQRHHECVPRVAEMCRIFHFFCENIAQVELIRNVPHPIFMEIEVLDALGSKCCRSVNTSLIVIEDIRRIVVSPQRVPCLLLGASVLPGTLCTHSLR